jgi:hypothetical protein
MSEIRVDTISEKTSANGVAVDGVTLKDGGGTFTSPVLVPDGSTSAVSVGNDGESVRFIIKGMKGGNYRKLIDPNTGIYFQAADSLGLVVGGSRKLSATSSGVNIENGALSAKGGAVNVNGQTVITTADNTDTLSLISTDADASDGPILRMYRNSGSPADGDLTGIMKFVGRNDNSQDVNYGSLRAFIRDASDGSEDGTIQINHIVAGTDRNRFQSRV